LRGERNYGKDRNPYLMTCLASQPRSRRSVIAKCRSAELEESAAGRAGDAGRCVVASLPQTGPYLCGEPASQAGLGGEARSYDGDCPNWWG
jgi:hypothetical protein